MDFIIGLPNSKGKYTIMVVVNRMSKYAHFIALRQPYTARDVAESFIRNIVLLHGIPSSIVCVFVSAFWRELFKAQGTQLKMSSSYHFQTDGQTEVVNRCLEQYLRCFTFDRPKEWEEHLPWADYWYNTTYQRSIDMKPFEVVYGRRALPIPIHEWGSTTVHEVEI